MRLINLRRGKVRLVSRRLLLEQLEERIVLDASAPLADPGNVGEQDLSNTNDPLGNEAPDGADSTGSGNDSGESGGDGSNDPSEQQSSPAAPELLMAISMDDNEPQSQDKSHGVRVLVVESGLEDASDLADAAKSGVITITYHGNQENPESLLSSIEEALNGRKVDSIAFAGHNSGAANLYLTTGHSLTLDSLTQDAELVAFWQGIGNMVHEGGHIDLLACDLTKTHDGRALVMALENLTGRDVAASDDATGNTEAGGDWILETGNLDASALYFSQSALANYDGILANAKPQIILGQNMGSLDETFGDDGIVTRRAYQNAEGSSVAVDSDGTILLGGTIVRSGLFGGNPTSFGFESYDSSGGFTDSGSINFRIEGGLPNLDFSTDKASSLAIQPDGKVVLAGTSEMESGDNLYRPRFAVARFNSDGSKDTAFSGGGVVTSFENDAHAESVAIQSNGKILVGGYSLTDDDGYYAMARYNANGELDTSFGTGGKVVTDFTDSSDLGSDIYVLPDGKILMAGTSSKSDGSILFSLVRYNSDGTLDDGTANDTTTGDSFGSGGRVTTDLGGLDIGNTLAVQSDGKIIVGGSSFGTGSADLGLVRYNSDGTLDKSFGSTGIVTTSIYSNANSQGEDIVIQPDGKILFTGLTYYSTGSQFLLVRYNGDGGLDETFGSNGIVTTQIDDKAYGKSVALQSDGKIVVGGSSYTETSDSSRYYFALTRYNGEPTSTKYLENEAPVLIDTNVNISDSDDPFLSSATVKIDNFVSGEDKLDIDETSWSLPSAITVTGQGTGELTFTGLTTIEKYEEILEHVTYENTSDAPDNTTRTISWTVNDGEIDSESATSYLKVIPVNDAPVNKFPSYYVAYEDQNATINGLSVWDDADGGDIKVTLKVEHGTLTAFEGGSVPWSPYADVENNGTKEITLTGTVNQINLTLAVLGGPQYLSDLNYNGVDTLTMTTNDQGRKGIGGAQIDEDTINITVRAINDAPVNTAPGDQTVDEDVVTAISGFSVSDPDAGGNQINVTFSANHGALIINDSVTNGLGAGDITGNGTASITLTGALAEINKTLAAATGLQYLSDLNYNGPDTLTMTTNDQGATGYFSTVKTDSVTIDITVDPVNDSPVNIVPGPQTAKPGVSTDIAGISVTDVDANPNDIIVNLDVAHGELTVNENVINGLGSGDIIGNGSGSVTLTGLPVEINNTLSDAAGLLYQSAANYEGPDTLYIKTDDQGNTGSGGPKIARDSVEITVTAQATNNDGSGSANNDGSGDTLASIGFHWKDYYDLNDNTLQGYGQSAIDSLPATYSLLDFLYSRGILPTSLTGGAGANNGSGSLPEFGLLLNQAIFGDDRQTRGQAWDELFGFIDAKKNDQQEVEWLGLREFLGRLQDSLPGKDLDDIALVFNAGEIELARWFDSLTGPEGESTSNGQTSSLESGEPVEQSTRFSNMIFDMDELRMTDISSLVSSNHDFDQPGKEVQSASFDNVSQVFDLESIPRFFPIAGKGATG